MIKKLFVRLVCWIERLRLRLAVMLGRRYITACLEEIIALKGQNRALRKQNEDVADAIIRVEVRYNPKRYSFGVISWVDSSVVLQYADADPIKREIIQRFVEQHFVRHMRGAFTAGAPAYRFPTKGIEDILIKP